MELQGYSDSKGKSNYNLNLSKLRVEFVKNEISKSNSKINIITSFYGEELNTDKTLNIENQQYRRVDVTIYYKELNENKIVSEEKPTKTNDIVKEEIKYKNTSEINESLTRNLEIQKFNIVNNEASSIKTRDGIVLSFKANNFNSSCEIVNLEIIEYNTKSDMILGNIQTVSNGKLIYSYGMFDIKAFCNDKEIMLNENTNYTVLVPNRGENNTVNYDNEGNLFYGVRNKKDLNTNWLIDEMEESNQVINQNNGNGIGKKERGRCFLAKAFKKNMSSFQKKEIRKKLEKSDFNNLKKVTLDEVAYFVLTPEKLGLINCDRFYNIPADEKITQKVLIANHSVNEVEMKIAFRDMKAVMSASKNSKYFEFGQIKQGLKATIVAIKVNKEEGIEIALKDITTSSEKIALEFEKVESMEVLNLLLEEINF